MNKLQNLPTSIYSFRTTLPPLRRSPLPNPRTLTPTLPPSRKINRSGQRRQPRINKLLLPPNESPPLEIQIPARHRAFSKNLRPEPPHQTIRQLMFPSPPSVIHV